MATIRTGSPALRRAVVRGNGAPRARLRFAARQASAYGRLPGDCAWMSSEPATSSAAPIHPGHERRCPAEVRRGAVIRLQMRQRRTSSGGLGPRLSAGAGQLLVLVDVRDGVAGGVTVGEQFEPFGFVVGYRCHR